MIRLFRLFLCLLALGGADRALAQGATVDLALVVSVDASGSVDKSRYNLQKDGIARALEDPRFSLAVANGRRGAIMFAIVQWSEHAELSVDWTRIASRADALAVAAEVRKMRRPEGQFTCVAHMMRYVSDLVLPDLPVKADRVVLDVSGDGVDNCDGSKATAQMRDELTAGGVTINGLPINAGNPMRPISSGAYRAPGRGFQLHTLTPKIKLLVPWYRENVIGGPGAFLIAAKGYGDFDRAILEKFVVEISARPPRNPHFALTGPAGSR